MKETGASGKKRSGSKAILYAVIGVIFLFLLALTSSIDVTFVYVFTGIATFFFFLSARDLIGSSRHDAGTGHYDRDGGRPAQPPSPLPDPSDILYKQEAPVARESSSSKKQKNQVSQNQSPTTTAPKSEITTVGCIAIIIVVSFFSIIGIVLFVVILKKDTGPDKIYYFETARNFYDRDQYDSAAINYRRALKLDANYEDAQMGYGKVLLYGLEQYDSALIMFDLVVYNNPENRDAAQHRGLVYFYQKKYMDGIKQALDILAVDPTYAQSMLLAGDCYYDQQIYDESLKWYQKAYDLNERSMSLAWRLAYMYDLKGDTYNAIPLYKQTLEYDTTLGDVYKRLGELIPGDDGNLYRVRAVQFPVQK